MDRGKKYMISVTVIVGARRAIWLFLKPVIPWVFYAQHSRVYSKWGKKKQKPSSEQQQQQQPCESDELFEGFILSKLAELIHALMTEQRSSQTGFVNRWLVAQVWFSHV